MTQFGRVTAGQRFPSAPDATPAISLLKVIESLSSAGNSITGVYNIQAGPEKFSTFRSECYRHAMIYATDVIPSSLSLLRALLDITATLQEAKYLRSLQLLNTLPPIFKDVDARAKLVLVKYKFLHKQLENLDWNIGAAKTASQTTSRQFWTMWRSATSSTGAAFDVLQSTVRELRAAVTCMEQFVQWIGSLAYSVKDLQGTGQLERLAHSWTSVDTRWTAGRHDLSYLEVLGSGVIATKREYENLRNIHKEFTAVLYAIPDHVPDKFKDEWFKEIKNRFITSLPDVGSASRTIGGS
jgi:hypothetical protein